MTQNSKPACLRAAALVAVAALSLGLAGAAQAQASRLNRNGDIIVAVVDTEAVTSVEVAQRVERLAAEAKRAGGPQPAADMLRQQVLDSLIDERVQITFAREVGQKVDDADIDRAVANVAAQNQLTVPQLRDRLKT